jgi:hypothetical protein
MTITPKTIGNITFDRLSLALAITGIYRPDGSPDASISIVLTPTAITEQGVVKAEEGSIQILRGHLSEVVDPDEAACVQAVQAALQQFVSKKIA